MGKGERKEGERTHTHVWRMRSMPCEGMLFANLQRSIFSLPSGMAATLSSLTWVGFGSPG